MVVQATLFSENLGFLPVNAVSQDWVLDNSSGYGLPDPFSNPFQPLQANEPERSHLSDLQPFRFSSQALSVELERQGREIDLFLHHQSERLKYAIQEHKRQQLSAMMRSLESKALVRMRKAEQDLAEATGRARELEDCLRRAEMETEVWEKVAKENEAMILSLNKMLGQAQERLLYWASVGPNSENQAQDEQSACEVGGCGGEDDKMRCKWCKKEVSSIVLLPCRHLCACRDCGRLLEICPVCQSVKEGVIEVLLR